MHGVLLLNKHEDISSAFAVAKLKRILGVKKIGHGGTLDPFACGLLPILVGNACKLSDYILNKDKGYIFTICFGQMREGFDRTGKVLATSNSPINQQELEKVILSFKGTYNQTPPLYSAIKHNGQRLYKLARDGNTENIDLESKKRLVDIKKIELRSFCAKTNKATIYALVSKGTYIRSLAVDIASSLQTVGYVDFLQRVSVAGFDIKDSLPLKHLQEMDKCDINCMLISMNDVLDDIPVVMLENEVARKLSNGLVAYNFPIFKKNGLFKAVYNNNVVALMQNSDENGIQILKVFNY